MTAMIRIRPMQTRLPIRPFVLALPLLAAGCADLDPYRREGMWQPEGVVQGNMAAMVANPTDLVRGRGTDEGDGGRGASAILKWAKAGPGGGPSLAGQSYDSGGGGGGGSGASGASGASGGGQ